MATLLLTHPDCLGHVTPPGHPERVDRLRAVLAALDAPEFAALLRQEAPLAPLSAARPAHPQRYIDKLTATAPDEGWATLDPDTYLSPGSIAAARRGLGACLAAVDAVMAGRAANAFCAIRPPGHHAERNRPMGFCLLANAALAALHALDGHGLARVAVVDFDVHHGNGTQDVLWNEPRALFVSTHQSPLYPGTGAPDERGAHGNVCNIPLPAGTDGPAYRARFEAEALPALEAFAPELVIISAGFDAHAADPLAGLALQAGDFAWITHRICDIAERHGAGRVVSTLEGGYDLDALAASAAAHVAVLMERGG